VSTNKKTDNAHPAAKLELRRYFLRKYHAGTPPAVLDCCQGEGLLWRVLRREFPVASYWGVDLKPARGRLAVDSVRIVKQPGWAQDVVDVDTYGSPWDHWRALLPRVTKPTTVFLTVGASGPTPLRTRLSREDLAMMGMTGRVQALVSKMKGSNGRFFPYLLPYALALAKAHNVNIVEAVECYEPPVTTWRTRYIGARLEPGGSP
jgi:hypothetical protein